MEQADRTIARRVREKTFTEQGGVAEAPEEASAIEKRKGNRIKGAINESRICSAVR